MSVSQLDHLNMSVRDFAEAADWYGRVFGFTVVERGEDDGLPWGVLRAGNALLCLYQHPDWQLLDPDQRAARGLHGLSHFGLRLHDRAAWERTVAREQVEVLYGGVVEWPHSLAWYVRDPTGHEIEVVLWNDDAISFAGRPV